MQPVIAVIAAGAMGAGVGARLTEKGARVLTILEGRSAASAERARRAGMQAATPEDVAGADVVLSIVPPAEALTLARRLAPALTAVSRKPVYADCNAISPRTVARVAEALGPTGCAFVDGGIIGGPPKTGGAGPIFYVSGPDAERLRSLNELGLHVRAVDGPIGAASALKMSYAGITKGLTALGAAMLLGASRAGASDALHQELARSQAQLLERFMRSMPDMYPKAYRWVAEMREIADFLEGDDAARMMLEGAARLYERIAADGAGSRAEIELLDAALAPPATRAGP